MRTQGEWKYTIDEDTITIYVPTHGTVAKIHKRWTWNDGSHQDNAEFIVRAVNAYDGMLEALKIAQAELIDAQGEWAGVTETYAPTWTHLIKSALSQIEAALAIAEGK